jgi:hypothetical protein
LASTLSQTNEFYVDTTTTTPVLLSDARPGIDYILKRVHTTGAHCQIGLFVNIEADDLDEVEYASANGVAYAIIPDTPFNRRQISIHNTTGVVADWSYSLIFADETEIEIIIPINNLVVRAVVAATQAITPQSGIECEGSGTVGLCATGGVTIGRALGCIVGSGTGTQVIAMVWYACQSMSVLV